MSLEAFKRFFSLGSCEESVPDDCDHKFTRWAPVVDPVTKFQMDQMTRWCIKCGWQQLKKMDRL